MRRKVTINGVLHTLQSDGGSPASFELDGKTYTADAEEVRPGLYSVLIDGQNYLVRTFPAEAGAEGDDSLIAEARMRRYEVEVEDPRKFRRNLRAAAVESGQVKIKSLMPGKVVQVLVSVNDTVDAGQGLVVVEAMKMQNEIKCPKAGKVAALTAKVGQAVNAGEVLLVIE